MTGRFGLRLRIEPTRFGRARGARRQCERSKRRTQRGIPARDNDDETARCTPPWERDSTNVRGSHKNTATSRAWVKSGTVFEPGSDPGRRGPAPPCRGQAQFRRHLSGCQTRGSCRGVVRSRPAFARVVGLRLGPARGPTVVGRLRGESPATRRNGQPLRDARGLEPSVADDQNRRSRSARA
jgi:hypothetical protein